MLFVYLIVLCQVFLVRSTVVPRSPCPDIFHYEMDDRPPKPKYLQIRGVITVMAPPNYTLIVKLEVPVFIPSGYKVDLVDTKKQEVTLASLESIRYNLFYPENLPVPQLLLIQLNNEVLCKSKPMFAPAKTTVTLQRTRTFRINPTPNKPVRPHFNRTSFPNSSKNDNSRSKAHKIPGNTVPNRNTRPRPKQTYNPIPNSGSCGVVINTVNPLVVGGVKTYRGEHPWMVALFRAGVEPIPTFLCTSCLISNQYIVTAAHCILHNKQPEIDMEDFVVYVGRYNIEDWAEYDITQQRGISEIHIHPDYNKETLYSDVAVMKLREPVATKPSAIPVCLWPWDPDLSYIVGSTGTVVGWGSDGMREYTEEPFKTTMPIVSQEECLSSGDLFRRIISNRTLCAGFRNGSGPCTGDSGGALLMQMKIGRRMRWFLRGLVSASAPSQGKFKCNLFEYFIFTDLAKFRSWLTRIVPNLY